jgi:hypothetical protein
MQTRIRNSSNKQQQQQQQQQQPSEHLSNGHLIYYFTRAPISHGI